MATIVKLAGPDDASAHVLFFHGLRGSIERTWGRIDDGSFWPAWLAEDIEGLAVWAVEFSAPASQWSRKSSLGLVDLAHVLASQIAHESQLETGSVALVGYSLGGIVAKAVMRAASDAKSDTYAISFFNRVERFASIATPHAGSMWATLQERTSWISLPSKLSRSLRASDPNLRDINRFFLNWVVGKPGSMLVISERGGAFFGKVVAPESANPGVVNEVPTDADHSSIVKVKSRDDVVFRALARFLSDMPKARLRVAGPTVTSMASRWRLLGDVEGRLASSSAIVRPMTLGDAATFSASLEELGRAPGLVSAVARNHRSARAPASLIDAEIMRRLDRLRGGRFVPTYPREAESRDLLEQLRRGDLAHGSAGVRADALAWCARLLAQPETVELAREGVEASIAIRTSDLTTIAEAFIRALSDRDAGLAALPSLNTEKARSAALFIASRQRPAGEALAWLESMNLRWSDLDVEGRLLLLSLLLQAERWTEARELVSALQPIDEEAPQLLQLSALALVTPTLPEEMRQVLLHVPIHPHSIPLSSDEASLADRRAAAALFDRFAPLAAELGCSLPAGLAEDMALWLRLRDPVTAEGAIETLKRSTDDPKLVLRRLTLLLDFGVELDLAAVEREIDREAAMSGSQVAAAARFAFAFTKESAAEAAAYLRSHWGELNKHLEPAALAITEVELLARAGSVEEAEGRLAALSEADIDPTIRARVKALIRGARTDGAPDPEAPAGVRGYPELMDAISAQVAAGEWAGVRRNATELLERTRDVNALVVLVRALAALREFSALHEVLSAHPDLRDLTDELKMQWAWSLFRAGDLAAARQALDRVQDEPVNATNLRINIAIASGQWDSLHALVEEVYLERDRTPTEQLLQTAHLAQALNSGRTRALVDTAVARQPNDPNVLIAAYSIATTGGWEADEEVGRWFRAAATLSGEEGPIQSISLEELVDRAPGWQERTTNVLEKVQQGELPLFMAAKLLNRTLTEMILVQGIANSHEPDPRRRAIIPTRSGRKRQPTPALRRVVMDPSTILVLLLAGVLEEVFAGLDHVVLPHDTLFSLFHDRQRLPFHQPSRIREAQTIRDLTASGALLRAEPQAPLPDGLAGEVGRELAQLLAEAQAGRSDGALHFVVRAGPIAKAGTLNNEVAEIGPLGDVMRSCGEVIAALRLHGVISEAEVRNSMAYLEAQEPNRASARPIPSGATLYLDSLSLTFLYHCEVLDRLSLAGFRTLVSPDAMTEQDNLLAYDRRATEVDRLITTARNVLEAGLESGKASLGPGFQGPEPGQEQLAHPSLRLFDLAGLGEAVVTDDRAFTRYDNIETPELVPVISSFELLESLSAQGRLTESGRLEAVGRLRRANVAFLPVEVAEVRARLAQATQHADGELIEPLELRSLRENLQSLAASSFLVLPNEAHWLMEFMNTLRGLVFEQWCTGVPKQEAAARAGWLLALQDIRMWSHRMPGEFDEERSMALFAPPLLLALIQFDDQTEGTAEFRAWVSDELLPSIKRHQPKIFKSLLSAAARVAHDFQAAEEETDG